MELTKYNKEDFETTEPFEELFKLRTDPFTHEIAVRTMADYANSMGIKNFKKLYGEYIKSRKKTANEIYINNVTGFSGQAIELDAGNWECSDFGVQKPNSMYECIACPHPILPTERLVNIDTGIEKLKIAFSKGRKWREIIVDKKTLASKNSIINLSDLGVAVTSKNADALVEYISDLENINYEIIPEKTSVSRLGYIKGEGFSPYVDGLVFDGDANYRHIFESVKSSGNRDKWLELAKEIRQGNIMARIVLATSFASVIVEPIGALTFFVHLWGGESGTGKTVALMLAASVWGTPEPGRYIQTFNSTVVGREKLAGFLNNLPLCVDELQLAKDSRGKVAFDVYQLAEGVGKTRGTKVGGIERTTSWLNTVITTGETPITSTNSAAGAVNRVIEIECSSSEKVIEDGRGVVNVIKKNYGFAGREFVEKFYGLDESIELANALYHDFFRKLSEGESTEKQSMAASVILTADTLATLWIFKDNRALTVDDISKFLASKATVSSGERGYRYMIDWVAQNSNKLRPEIEQGEIYGVLDGDYAYIIGNVFRKAASDGGFSPNALLSFLKQNELILVREKNNTLCKRINNTRTECVCLKLSSEIDEDIEEII